MTNGGHADSFVMSTTGVGQAADAGEFSCVIVERDREGVRWGEPWRGMGMRGNESRSMKLESVRVPRDNLLGERGDQIWYVFEIVAPYFLLAMAGTYLGVAEAALALAAERLETRTFSHSGQSLTELPTLQSGLADSWLSVARTRALLYRAAALGDVGDEEALVHILTAKVAAAETAVLVTNEALTLGGGRSYRQDSTLGRLLRDARACHVMAPTTNVLKQWAGRSLLGLPLL